MRPPSLSTDLTSRERPPIARGGSRSRTARWFTSTLTAATGLLLVNSVVAPPAQAAYTQESRSLSHGVATSGQDIAFKTLAIRKGPLASGECYDFQSITWELSGASTSTKETKYEDAIAKVVSKIPRKVGYQWVLSADGNTMQADNFKASRDGSCPDWITNDYHDRALGTLSDAATFAANFGGYFAISVTVAAAIELLGETFLLPGEALTPTYIKGAACIGGVVGGAYLAWRNKKDWKTGLAYSLIACVSEMTIPGIGTKMKKVFRDWRVNRRTANLANVVPENSLELADANWLDNIGDVFGDAEAGL